MPRSQKDASGGAGGGGCIIQKMKNCTHTKRVRNLFSQQAALFTGVQWEKTAVDTHTHTPLTHRRDIYTAMQFHRNASTVLVARRGPPAAPYNHTVVPTTYSSERHLPAQLASTGF